jgi:hypothetical protein
MDIDTPKTRQTKKARWYVYNPYLQHGPFNEGLLDSDAGFMKHKSYCVDYKFVIQKEEDYERSETVNPVHSHNSYRGKQNYPFVRRDGIWRNRRIAPFFLDPDTT